VTSHRPLSQSRGLVVVGERPSPDAPDDEDVDPAVCPACAGPVRICGGTQRCTTGALDPSEQRWVTAIRLVYVGVCLTSTPASLWGGAMLRLAKRMADTPLSEPRAISLAVEHADPGEDAARCASLALHYLGQRAAERGPMSEHSAARELYSLLRPRTAARWLHAAVATPLGERVRFPLFTVLCARCALPGRGQFAHVSTYDEAIRCPGCLVIHRHPIRAVTIGAPHPVGRCLPDPRDPQLCMVHDEGGRLALDREGLCPEGRATMVRAEALVAELGEPITRAQRTLFNAVARAKDVMPEPFVAAVAEIDPEAARDLWRFPGLTTAGEMAASFFETLSTDIRKALRIPGEKDTAKTLTRPATKSRRKGRGTEGST
jgi:hypothetical protein